MARVFLILFLLAGCATTPSGTSRSAYNHVAVGPNEEVKISGYNSREMGKYRCINGIMVWSQFGAAMSGKCYASIIWSD